MLVTVLLDKDNRIKEKIIPTDEEYHNRKPTMRQFDDCCNEFCMCPHMLLKDYAKGNTLFNSSSWYSEAGAFEDDVLEGRS